MRKLLFNRKAISFVLALTLASSLAAAVSAQALAITTNDFIPFAQAVFVPCADGGAGEVVLISGTLHVQNHITINNNRASIKSHFQPQGASGVGVTTGDVYHATGVTQEHDSVPLTNGAFEFTFINNFRIIGEGPDNNLLVHQTVHVTVNANGDVTSNVTNTSVECR
jgi:hypothetical protein